MCCTFRVDENGNINPEDCNNCMRKTCYIFWSICCVVAIFLIIIGLLELGKTVAIVGYSLGGFSLAGLFLTYFFSED